MSETDKLTEDENSERAADRANACYCPACGGDGKETCDNPDHGFTNNIGGDTGRLGCPVCGHDPEHKVPSGGDCEICNGIGRVSEKVAIEYCGDDIKVEYVQTDAFN